MQFKSFLLSEQVEGIWFHGSPYKFDAFKKGSYKRDLQLGFGIHFTQDEDFAELYGNYIYECKLHVHNTLDITKIYNLDSNEHEFAKEIYARTKYQLAPQGNQFAMNLDVAGPKKVEKLLMKYGYDSVLYEAKYGGSSFYGAILAKNAISITVLEPNKVEILDVKRIF